MKKVSLIAAAAFVALASMAPAQDQFAPVWERWVGGAGANSVPAWFNTANTTRGATYNLGSTEASGESVILVTRDGGNAIHVASAANGDLIRTLDLTGVSGGLFGINVANSSPEGKIYVAGLESGTAGGPIHLYEWANDAASTVPVKIQSAFNSTQRAGDAIEYVASGANRTIYIVGNNGGSRVVALNSTDSGATWTASEVGPTRGAVGVTSFEVGGEIFLKSGGLALQSYDQAGLNDRTWDATAVPGIQIGQVGNIEAFDFAGGKHILMQSYRFSAVAELGNPFTRNQIATLDLTAGTGEITLEIPVPTIVGALANGNDNGNGSGGINIWEDNGSLKAFVMATNNYYGVYQYTPASISDWDLMR